MNIKRVGGNDRRNGKVTIASSNRKKLYSKDGMNASPETVMQMTSTHVHGGSNNYSEQHK